MPFTFAHPAAVLPLKPLFKNRLSMTGLIVGSIVPDFEYFTKTLNVTAISHTIKGIFFYDLPMSFIISLLFLFVVRQPLLLALPAPFDARYSSYCRRRYRLTELISPRKAALFTLSIIIGLATHLLWDSFTHLSSPIVRNIPFFLKKINIGSHPVAVYRILQHASSLFGITLTAIAFFSYKPAETKTTPQVPGLDKLFYWITFSITAVTMTAFNLYVEYFHMSYHLDLWKLVSYTISGFLSSLLITSIFFRLRWSLKVREQFFYD